MSLCFGKKNLASLVFWSLAWPPRENMPNYKLIFTILHLSSSRLFQICMKLICLCWQLPLWHCTIRSGIRTLFQANTIAKWLMHQLKNSSSKNAALPLLSRSSRSQRRVKKRWKTGRKIMQNPQRLRSANRSRLFKADQGNLMGSSSSLFVRFHSSFQFLSHLALLNPRSPYIVNSCLFQTSTPNTLLLPFALCQDTQWRATRHEHRWPLTSLRNTTEHLSPQRAVTS